LKIVGITGSQGKTTTKDMLATVLSKDGKTIAPIGSYNNEIGVPITLLRANGETKYAVLEMGARHMGDIGKLTEIAEPNVGIVLKVGVAHLGEFGSRENIARTKGELIRGLQSGSTAVLGTYDEFTPHIADGLDLKVLHFGETTECDVRAADIEIKGGFATFDLVTSGGRERVELQILGQHQIANALAAAAAATAFGLDIRTIAEGLSEHSVMSKWRMELHQIGDITIINDAYNSNPESCIAALQTLRQLTQERGGRSWAFLGKMHELGDSSDQLHNEVGSSALASNIDNLIVIAEPAFLAGLSSTSTFMKSVSDWQAACRFLSQVESGDVILIKGSRAEKLDLLAIETLNFFKNKYEGENQ
jgi:UDP-N-acetylmuramoyl-tripeptide--D-alanyl-D-alanine ligase